MRVLRTTEKEETRKLLTEIINWTVGNAAQFGDLEMVVAMQAARIPPKPEPEAGAKGPSSPFLCGVNAFFNKKIYQTAVWLVRSYGEEIARLYVQQFTPVPLAF